MTAATATRTGHRWVAFAVLLLAVLLVSVDGTVLGVAAPFISRDLATSGPQLLWIADVYSFVLAGLLVTMGGLGDRIGRKKLLMCGATAFGVLSAFSAYAPTAAVLIAARALLGVAGATLMPSTLALIRALFPDARARSLAVGIWSAAASAGASCGPVLGGFLLEHFWWGSVFLINVPVVAVLVPAGLALLPESRDPAPGPWDLLGVAWSLVGMIGTVYAVKEAAVHGLRADVVVAAVVGVTALALFVRRQSRSRHPLVDVRLFCDRAFSGVIGATLLAVLGLSGLLYFLSQFFQLVQGYSPLQAGVAEVPAVIGSVLFGVLAGVLARRWSTRAVLSAGLALVCLAMAALVPIGPDTGYPLLGTALFVLGSGIGLSFTVAGDVVLSIVPAERAGAASAVSETAYELGTALGIALLGSVVTGVYRGFDGPPGTPSAAHDSLASAVEIAETLPAHHAATLLTAAQHAFTHALAVASAVGAVLLLVAAVAVWPLLAPTAAPSRRT
ncbi:MFS transporter [Saccharopolyspora rosea]|uniref:MFS transporter n=1 Tax=Saccharopolyspora rosea TaxID=524884 RepID=A0ABW3G4A3_9PSEU|nr:MFS transporter [Saccharopolyspora rosea]